MYPVHPSAVNFPEGSVEVQGAGETLQSHRSHGVESHALDVAATSRVFLPSAKEASSPDVSGSEQVGPILSERTDLDQPIDERNVDLGLLGQFIARQDRAFRWSLGRHDDEDSLREDRAFR